MLFNENNEETRKTGGFSRTAVGNADLSRRAMILGSAASVALLTIPPAALALESQPASIPNSPTLDQGEETMDMITTRDGVRIYYKDWGAYYVV